VRRSLLGEFAKGESREKFGLAPETSTVLVMGGSQGARGINQAMIGAARSASVGEIQFIHITGGADESMVRDAYRSAGVKAWVGACHHGMQDAYGASDLAVARSGAASLTELAHFRIPAILIPYPHAAEDHQTLNAKVFEKEGAAVLMPESEPTAESLSREMVAILKPEIHAAMSEACARLSVDDAAQRVAKVLLEAASMGNLKK
jgi:UDP-N-acetylglucosamine--N-acetylmuramyl-(pentapeptide) pyrophosphoryl-undecaprenol N-acetylglucosamine transferase